MLFRSLVSVFVGFPLDFCFLFFLPFANYEEKQESFTLRAQWGCRGIFPPAFLFAQNAFCADGLKEVLTPNQREVNMRSRALLATARSEVRSSENMEHSASKLTLVGRVGNLSKSGKAQKLNNSTDYDRWIHIQAGKLNWGSLLLSALGSKIDQAERQVRSEATAGGR